MITMIEGLGKYAVCFPQLLSENSAFKATKYIYNDMTCRIKKRKTYIYSYI